MTGQRQSEPRYDAPDRPRRNVSKEDLQQQVKDGLITKREAGNIAAGKNPNGTKREKR
jgi:hypothetical protein